jgi:predicted nuclease of predicted toxin-antitoxin system
VRIKLDESVPLGVARLLSASNHDVDTVVDEDMSGRPDRVVEDAAVREGRMLITLDRGFPVTFDLPTGHPGIIVLRLQDQSVAAVRRLIADILAHGIEELAGALVIASPGRVRLRRGQTL